MQAVSVGMFVLSAGVMDAYGKFNTSFVGHYTTLIAAAALLTAGLVFAGAAITAGCAAFTSNRCCATTVRTCVRAHTGTIAVGINSVPTHRRHHLHGRRDCAGHLRNWRQTAQHHY